MSYPAGTNYADGINALRVPYFSNPNINFEGQPTGDAARADAARSLREIKHVITSYSDRIPNLTAAPGIVDISNLTDIDVMLRWSAVANAASYNLYFREINTAAWSNPAATNINATRINLSGSFFSPGTTYEFYVAAVNGCGDEARNQTQTFTTLPSVGTNLYQSETDSHISIYPNPTDGIVNISQEGNIKLYTMQGLLLQESFGNRIDLSDYPQGIYLLHVGNRVVKVLRK